MKTIIFESVEDAKVYEIRSAKAQGIYKAGELVRIVKTDDIDEVLDDGQHQLIATEIDV